MSVDTLAQNDVRDRWNGVWIWPEDVQVDRNAYALFRKTFETRSPARLTIDVTANHFYTFHLDSQFVARGPIRGHLRFYPFDSFTLSVEPGVHCLAVVAHHVGEENATMQTGRPGFLADVRVEENGRTTDLSTSRSWTGLRCDAWKKDLPCLMSHFGFWEELDLRRYPHGWTESAFDDRGWSEPAVIGAPPCEPWTCLVRRDIPDFDYVTRTCRVAGFGQWSSVAPEGDSQPRIPFPERKNSKEFKRPDGVAGAIPSERVHARSRRPAAFLEQVQFPLRLNPCDPGKGHYLTLDLGTTLASGFAVVKLGSAQTGQTIDVCFGEILCAPGSLNPERSYVNNCDRYILSGTERQVRSIHPRGFRYVMIDVAPGEHEIVIDDVHVVEEAYPFKAQDAFTCSDRDLDTLFQQSDRTIRGCTIDCFVDNAVRERVHWTGEAMFVCELAAALLFADTAMSRRGLFQSAQGILPDGRINGFTPTTRTNCSNSIRSLLWLEHLVDYWIYAGDLDDIRMLLPTAERILGCLERNSNDEELIDKWPVGQYWDWSNNERGGHTSCLLLTNAFYVHAIGRLAGQDVLAEKLPGLAERAARIRARCHDVFWDADQALYRDGILDDGTPGTIFSQFANSAAVLADICPADRKVSLLHRITDAALLDRLGVGEAKRELVRGTVVPASTPWSAYWLCRAFFEAGLDIEAVEHLKTIFGEFKHLPTLPEVRVQHGNTNLCQSVGPAVAHLLCSRALGIEPTAGGWRQVRFAPGPARLTSVSGQFRTPLGPLTARVDHVDGQYELQLQKPEDMVVRVQFRDIDEVVNRDVSWQCRCR